MRAKLKTEADGRKLAVKMLAEIEVYETAPGDMDTRWPWNIQAKYRPENTQQDNVVLRYVDALQGNKAALAGFCALLTDYLGEIEHVGPPNLEFYKTLTTRDITGKPGPWPTMDDEENEERAAFEGFLQRATDA